MATGNSTRLRFGYACGSLVTGTFTTLPGLLLLPYLTDTLGVGAALAGVVILVPKAWAVLLAPFAGRTGDRTHRRRGSRRRHVLGGGLGATAAFAVMLAGVADGTAGMAWTGLGFLLTATAFAFFQAAYAALPADIAHTPHDRMRLVSGRVAGIAVAGAARERREEHRPCLGDQDDDAGEGRAHAEGVGEVGQQQESRKGGERT
ncbi:MFS transporter, partial [Streptomyces sp. sk2.1]|uniref:MFS transporter n=1 Tax=Streptomyces sp. sk2.1 TaxID=2478959 RepID=UPI0021CC5FAB